MVRSMSYLCSIGRNDRKNKQTDLIFLSLWKFKLKRNCDDHPKEVKTIVFKTKQIILMFTDIKRSIHSIVT